MKCNGISANQLRIGGKYFPRRKLPARNLTGCNCGIPGMPIPGIGCPEKRQSRRRRTGHRRPRQQSVTGRDGRWQLELVNWFTFGQGCLYFAPQQQAPAAAEKPLGNFSDRFVSLRPKTKTRNLFLLLFLLRISWLICFCFVFRKWQKCEADLHKPRSAAPA